MKFTLIIVFTLIFKLPVYSNTEEILVDSIYQNRDNIIENPQYFLNRLNSIEDPSNSLDKMSYATFTILKTEVLLNTTEGAVKDGEIYKAVKILKYCNGEEYRYAYGLLTLGYTLYRNFDTETALKYLYEAIECCKKVDECKLMGDIYLFIGSIKSLDIASKADHFQEAYNQYIKLEDYESSTEALFYLVTLKKEISIDGNLFNIDSIIELSQRHNLPNKLAFAYIHKANLLRAKKDFNNYINSTLKAYQLRDKLTPKNRQTVYNEYLFSKIYQSRKDRDSAITKLDSILNKTIALNRKTRITWYISKGHEINKDYKQALSYYKLYQKYRDQTINNENERMMISSLNKYKTLEIKNELAEQKLKEKTYLSIAIGVFSILMVIIITLISRRKIIAKERKYLNRFAAQLTESQNELYDLLVGIPNRDKSSIAEYIKFCSILETKIKIPRKHSKILKSCDINTIKAFEVKMAMKNNFPNLTPDDILYCSLIYQNIRNEEIAKLTNIQEQSVVRRKQRLAKKMDLRAEQDLVRFIKNIVNKEIKKMK